MLTCPSCGVENKDDARFCLSCGAPVEQVAPVGPAAAPPPPPPPGWVRPRERGTDYMGLVGFALFLFVVGVVFYANPNLGADLRLWVERMTANGPFIRPPEGVISGAVVFFLLMGVSSFATSVLRFAIRRHRLKALSDAMGGVALLILSFLLTLYADRRISGQLVLATWVAVLGALLLIYIALGVYLHWVRIAPKPAPESASRP